MLARDGLVQAGLPDNPYARQLRNGFRWLRFEKELENEFREFLSWNSLMQRRAAIGVAFLIWTLFIVADWLMVDIRLHPNLFEQLLGVRLGMIGLLLVVWPAAFLPSLRKVGDAIAPYCLLLINLAVLACDVLFEWHGVPRFTQLGATLGILAVFFPLGLAFWACVRLALLCLALNLAVFLLFGGEENLRTNLLNTLYNGLVVLICSFALYLQDYAQREQFLGRRLLGMMAEQDSLTGLVNRRYYELLAQRALEQGAREEKGVALILVDVDDFKAYNDHYGHPAGDAALRQLGVVLRQGGGGGGGVGPGGGGGGGWWVPPTCPRPFRRYPTR
ncbi:diguanylate cyclase, partial [Pseudomonas aeruginosa]|uniref:GGDEF domain-containing protein n=1 Tax=Pseudomonas aeruginosa TaxID=287 RepID=UPI0039C3B499